MSEKIILYTKPGCPTCKVFCMKLEKKGIPFEKVEDEAKLVELGQTYHIESAPIFYIDGKYLSARGAKPIIDAWEV